VRNEFGYVTDLIYSAQATKFYNFARMVLQTNYLKTRQMDVRLGSDYSFEKVTWPDILIKSCSLKIK